MAAALKKRVLAEYTSQTIQEDTQPIKRLRLVYKPTPNEPHLHLHNAQSSTEILTRLLQFEQRLPSDTQTAENEIRELSSHYDRERDNSVRCKIATVMRELVKVPGVDAESLVENILALLKNEKSHKVVSQLLKILQTLGCLLPSNPPLLAQLITTATQWLNDSNFSVRTSCLELIAALCPLTEKQSDSSMRPIQQLLGQHASDTDPRVRTAALRAVLSLHERGIMLEASLYDISATCLGDDVESVRRAAIKLLWVVCQIYHNRPAAGSDSLNEMSLLDDGFVRICNSINDVSCVVRIEAASLLGSLHNVSPRFLRQTLDKKLMSSMRRKISAHERARESYVSGEWATGQKWAADAPREAVNPEEISLMNIGACGAFVHGLEDEYLDVRNAALDSLCELASQNPMFAVLSQDSIIDMFNDEIESVRLNAINSLRKISQHIVLREDQLEIILGVLQDFSSRSRVALREMLGDMKLGTKACLTACVMGLLDNLTRYPQDKDSVLKLMQSFGTNHPELTSAIMPDVLCIHPYFETPEPDMQDPNYVSILVMVVNAAAHNSSMLSLFHDHIWRHYRYLRSSIPHRVPLLQNNNSLVIAPSSVSTSITTSSYISSVLQRLSNLHTEDLDTANELLNITIRDVDRMNEIVAGHTASAECLGVYFATQTALIKLLRGTHECGLNAVTDALLNKILKSCVELKHVYIGLGCEEMAIIRETEIKALALRAVSQATNANTSTVMESLFTHLSDANRMLQSSGLTPDPFTTRLLQEQANPHANVAAFLETLRAAIPIIKPRNFAMSNQIRRITATISEPASSILDKPIKFTAGMTSSICLIAMVENAVNLSDLRVQLRYPNMRTDHMAISAKDVTKLSPLKHRLNTQVILSHCLTSEPFEVEMCIVLIPCASSPHAKDTTFIKLCKPIKISLAPKSSKR